VLKADILQWGSVTSLENRKLLLEIVRRRRLISRSGRTVSSWRI
jgi:hypothetical protein